MEFEDHDRNSDKGGGLDGHRPVTDYGVEIGIGKVLRHHVHISYNSQRRGPQAWSQDKSALAVLWLIQRVIKRTIVMKIIAVIQ